MKTFTRVSLGIILTAFTLFSCERAKRKASDLSDQVFPTFDPMHPDTRANKNRFAEFFGFAPTADVKDLYCYSSESGIDAAYYFSFMCDATTVQKITSELKLTQEPAPAGLSGFDLDYDWWNRDAIETIKPLTRHDGSLYWYLWYDEVNGQVYFLTFDT